jgi:hypothetical protein
VRKFREGVIVVGLALVLAPITTLGASGPDTARMDAPGCRARTVSAKLEVICPAATLVEFLAALQHATGLRSDHPQELASTQISITRHSTSLLEVLEDALAAFNFAVWIEQHPRSHPRIRIVDLRGSRAAGNEAEYDRTPEVSPDDKRAQSSNEVLPAGGDTADGLPESSTLMARPLTDALEMARAREEFTNSITDSDPLEPPPSDDASVLVPDR